MNGSALAEAGATGDVAACTLGNSETAACCGCCCCCPPIGMMPAFPFAGGGASMGATVCAFCVADLAVVMPANRSSAADEVEEAVFFAGFATAAGVRPKMSRSLWLLEEAGEAAAAFDGFRPLKISRSPPALLLVLLLLVVGMNGNGLLDAGGGARDTPPGPVSTMGPRSASGASLTPPTSSILKDRLELLLELLLVNDLAAGTPKSMSGSSAKPPVPA